MSLFNKDKKPRPIEYKTGFFIHGGEWYRNTSEMGIFSARIEENSSVVPQEYMEHWAGWKPSQPNRSDSDYSFLPNKRSGR